MALRWFRPCNDTKLAMHVLFPLSCDLPIGQEHPLQNYKPYSSLSQRLENILSHFCTKPGVKDATPLVTTARRASVMCSADMACVSRLHWPTAPKMAQLVVKARSSFETDRAGSDLGAWLSQVTKR